MDSALVCRVGSTILNEMTCVKNDFLDLPIQCSDGTILCQKLTMCLLGPLIGRSLSGVEEPLLVLPDNTCQELAVLLRMVWDQDTSQDFSEEFFSTYHWIDFRLERKWTISTLTTSLESLPGFYMSEEEREVMFYETHQNFEEKFSQFAKQLDSEKQKTEINKTFEVITKHLQTNLEVELVEASPQKTQGPKVQTIPMECDTYDNCDSTDISPSKTISNKETSQCAQCGKILHDKFSLKKHEQIVHMKIKNFTCDKCEKKFGHKVDLLDHIRTIHDKVKQFICDLCGLALSSRQTLKTHRLIHEASTKNIICDICNKSFRHKNTYNKHIRRVHEFDSSKSLQCNVCNKSFKHDEGLKRHVKKMHDNISVKYPCNLCQKTFAFMYDLTKHAKSHNTHGKGKATKKPVPMTLDNNQIQPETFYVMKDMEGNPIEFDIAVVAPNLNSILGQ
eukprot:TRINITY_DN35314_c0_g1_i1.p1 TRINITY_DN35314_c0_g1~~TRINITY_DN35314_c0_g1_i1.p1  ORF type:complete len:448 (-),score=80.34 TRINITY_DN35314_c0_g1_i1:40-1383(-)